MHRTPKVCRHGLCLLAVAVYAASAAAGHRPPVPKSPPRTLYEHRFTAFADTVAGAEQNALEDAGRWLARQARLGWVPAAEYVRAHAEVEAGVPTEEQQNLAADKKWKVVTIQVRVNSAQAEQIAREARYQVMTGRQGLLARVVGGVLALVLVCAGYLRLEEATRGYYTLLLRAGALLVLAAVGAVLWVTTL
jgi:hypothetical protein